MEIKTTINDTISYGEVIKPGSDLLIGKLTSRYNLENTAHSVALGLVYTDLLISGSANLSRDEFQSKLNELGSTIEVSLDKKGLLISINSLKSNLKPTLALFVMLMSQPSFTLKEFKRAKQSLKNVLELSKEDARELALAGLKNSFFNSASNQYTHPPESLIKAVDTVAHSDIKRFHNLILESSWIATAGGDSYAIKSFKDTIKKLKKQKVETVAYANNTFIGLKKCQAVLQEVKTKQNIEVSIGGYLPLTLKDDELPAFVFGLNVLAKWGGFSGRLMSTVREKEGLTYMIYGRTEGITATEAGCWRIATFFSPKDFIKGINSTINQIEKIARNGITESESERFKTILKTGETLVFDSLTNTTELVHIKLVSGISWEEHVSFREALYSCTRNQVNNALKDYLNTSSLTVSAAGPTSAVKQQLKQLLKVLN
ncbi:MAG: insulinase family protein [Candidatus Paceibacterota bacterium]